MNLPTQSEPQKYSYSDYLTWPDDERWEIIDGIAFAMSPSPVVRHQKISGSLARTLLNHFYGKECTAFTAPLDVVLSEYDVVQPDLLVVCDPYKIKTTHIEGAPDLIVEILSPSTSGKDKREKFALYEKSGVKEYIIAHPSDEFVERFFLADGKYGLAEVFTKTEKMHSLVFAELEFDLAEVFAV